MSTSDGRGERIHTAFINQDVTGSGFLNMTQFGGALSSMGLNLDQNSLTNLFAEADADGNGLISFAEFQNAALRLMNSGNGASMRAPTASHSMNMTNNSSFNASKRTQNMTGSGMNNSGRYGDSMTAGGVPSGSMNGTGGGMNDRLYRLFKSFDLDGDDVLSIKELQAAFSSFGDTLSDVEAVEMISYAKGGRTSDGTQGVSFEEFRRVMSE